MKHWSLFLLSALLGNAHAYESTVTPYIVNGTNVNLANYPTFASLFYRTNTVYSTSSFCGATVINSQYVLTAAHCIYDNPTVMLYTVVAPGLQDESNFLSSTQARASEFYYPDNYVDSSAQLWANDIAIIKLETPLPLPDYFSYLNNSTNTTYPAGNGYKAVGHGYIEGNLPGGTQLLETDLTFVNNATCQGIYGSSLTSKQICFDGVVGASSYKNATCSGDSGGPVYQFVGGQYIQIGITSFGPTTCGNPSSPVVAVFTEVYDYIGWIINVINGLETPKYYIATANGSRSLIKTSEGSVASEPVDNSATPADGGGGGALSWLFLLLLSIPRALSHTFLWRVAR